jgi:hypothetical protein
MVASMIRRPLLVRRALASAGLIIAVLAGATSPAVADRAVDGSNAILGTPPEVVTRSLSPVQGCQVLLDSGDGDCTVVHTEHGDLVVTVESGPRVDDVLVSRPWIVRVYRPAVAVPDGWELALSTRPEDGDVGPVLAGVAAKAVDVTGDGHDELVIGYRSEGTGDILDVDIVGTDEAGTPAVVVHDQLYKGNVIFKNGRLISYAPVYRKMDANCCPTSIERDVLRYRDGVFHFHEGRRVPTHEAVIPASQLA